MRRLAQLAVGAQPTSFSSRLRRRRFRWFEQAALRLPRPLRILDVGGRNEFWRRHGWAGRDDIQIVLLNIVDQPRRYHNIHPHVGDAADLSEFDDDAFDIAFSNSVIEHLYTFERQQAMAREIQRVGHAYWVQTPNFWFPLEPHFLVPGWQWMPRAVRTELLHRLPIGGEQPDRDRANARRRVEAIRLLTRRELAAMFPGGTIRAERMAGAVKSWIVHDGLPVSGR